MAIATAAFAVLAGSASAADPAPAPQPTLSADVRVAAIEAVAQPRRQIERRGLEVESPTGLLLGDAVVLHVLLHRRLQWCGPRARPQAWFDNAAGRWVVALSPQGDEAAVREFLESLGLGGSEIVRRHFDHVRLAETLDRLSERVASHRRAGDASVGIGAGAIEVRFSEDAPQGVRAEVRGFVRETGVDASFVERSASSFFPSPSQGCTFQHCDRLTAGVETLGARGDGWVAGCTAGFYVGSPHDGRPFMLTAGHCVQHGSRWDACIPGGGCGPVGTEIGGYYGGGDGDAALRRVDFATVNGWDPGWNMYEGWVNWWNVGISTVRGWLPESAGRGTYVCHQGTYARSACGTVNNPSIAVDYYRPETNPPQYETTVGGMIEVVGTCAGPRDSGGPWTEEQREVAIGIHSGAWTRGNCDERNDIAYVEPIHRALQRLNVVIYGR